MPAPVTVNATSIPGVTAKLATLEATALCVRVHPTLPGLILLRRMTQLTPLLSAPTGVFVIVLLGHVFAWKVSRELLVRGRHAPMGVVRGVGVCR